MDLIFYEFCFGLARALPFTSRSHVPPRVSSDVPYLIGVSVAMLVVFWFETIRLWRKLAV
jgi:hypothetical protein